MTTSTNYIATDVATTVGGFAPLSTKRITLTGGGTSQWDMQFPAGTSMRTGGKAPWGYNLGVFEYYSEAEVTTLIAQLYSEGVRLVRLVGMNRTFGSPSKDSGDSNRIFSPPGTDVGSADKCWNRKNPKHWRKLQTYARAVEAISRAHPTDPMWFVVCMEGDIKQSGTQDTAWSGSYDPTNGTFDRALTLPFATLDTIPGGAADWGLAGGLNVFTSRSMFAQVLEEAQALAREFRSYDYLFAYEFLSEPLPPSGKFPSSPTPPNGRVSPYYIYPGDGAGNYDSSWTFRAGNTLAAGVGGLSTGPGTGKISIEEYYRILFTAVAAIDPNTPFIYGGSGGYNLDPEGLWITTALSDPTGLGGDWRAANKLIFTWDRLGAGTNQCSKTPNTAWVASKLLVALFMNQLGERNTGDGSKDPGDANTWGLMHAVRTYKQWGIPGTIWDRRGNTSGGYGSEYSSGGADGDGANGTYTVVEPRRTNLATVFGETYAAIEAAGIAAANAENAYLFYVKDDLSNVFQPDGVTPWSSGSPVIGTSTVGKITPVVDALGTGLVWTPAVGGTIKLDYPWKDGAASTYLPDKKVVLSADNVADATHSSYLIASIPYFGSTPTSGTATGDENWGCMVAGVPGDSSSGAMTFFCAGNGSTIVRCPQIVATTGKTITAKVTGDPGGVSTGPTLPALNTSTYALQAGVPIVATVIKSGTHTSSAVQLLVNGIDDTGVVPGGYAGSATGETLTGTGNTLTAQAVGSVSSFARVRVFATGNTGDFVGTLAGFCLFRQAPSLANARAIGRLLAARQGGGFKT